MTTFDADQCAERILDCLRQSELTNTKNLIMSLLSEPIRCDCGYGDDRVYCDECIIDVVPIEVSSERYAETSMVKR